MSLKGDTEKKRRPYDVFIIFNEMEDAMANATQSICVVENTTVAGTRHVAGMAEMAENYRPGDRFALVRDSGNRRVGYVSCECNEFVGRLIDGGKSVDGRLVAREQVGSWCRLVMEVHLND